MKRFRALKILCVIALILVGAFYFIRIHRYSHTLTKGGWQLDYATPLMACPCCFSRISRLEFNGTPIRMPGFPVDDDRRWFRSSLDTPLGLFRITNSLDGWRYFYGDGIDAQGSGILITEEDLRRGFYVPEVEGSIETTASSSKVRMPKHWCLLYGHVRCWLDPLRFDQIDWQEVSTQARQ